MYIVVESVWSDFACAMIDTIWGPFDDIEKAHEQAKMHNGYVTTQEEYDRVKEDDDMWF